MPVGIATEFRRYPSKTAITKAPLISKLMLTSSLLPSKLDPSILLPLH